jgi:hypothetical protein
MSTFFFVTRILNSNHNFSEEVVCGGAACEALGNTVSPSLPFIMSQFLHGRAEGGRVLKEEVYNRRDGFDMRGCAAHTRHDLQGAAVRKNARFRGDRTWRINAFDRNNERIAIGSGVPLRWHTSAAHARVAFG